MLDACDGVAPASVPARRSCWQRVCVCVTSALHLPTWCSRAASTPTTARGHTRLLPYTRRPQGFSNTSFSPACSASARKPPPQPSERVSCAPSWCTRSAGCSSLTAATSRHSSRAECPLHTTSPARFFTLPPPPLAVPSLGHLVPSFVHAGCAPAHRRQRQRGAAPDSAAALRRLADRGRDDAWHLCQPVRI